MDHKKRQIQLKHTISDEDVLCTGLIAQFYPEKKKELILPLALTQHSIALNKKTQSMIVTEYIWHNHYKSVKKKHTSLPSHIHCGLPTMEIHAGHVLHPRDWRNNNRRGITLLFLSPDQCPGPSGQEYDLNFRVRHSRMAAYSTHWPWINGASSFSSEQD